MMKYLRNTKKGALRNHGRLGRELRGGRSQWTDVFFSLGQKLSNLTDAVIFAI